MAEPNLVWPDGIDSFVPTEALVTALFLRSDVCVIALAHEDHGQVRMPYYAHGDKMRAIGLAVMLITHLSQSEEGTEP